MGTNVLAEFFKSQQDREELKKIEQLRRKGHGFIKVRYIGPAVPKMDAEGVVYNIRLHGLRDIEAFEKTDINTGRAEWHSRPGARALSFRQSPTGDIEADIWDDPDTYNRHFICTHPELEVTDSKLAEEIKSLAGTPFKAELTNEEVLEREIAAKQRELDQLKKVRGVEETPATPEAPATPPQEKVYRGGRKRGARDRKPRKKRIVNGLNNSASSVDSAGVSRVATGGNTEGDSAAVQSGAQDSQHVAEGTKPTV